MINGFSFLKRADSIWKIYDITQFRGSYYSPPHIFAQWKSLIWLFQGDQSTRNFNLIFFQCSTKVTSFILPLMNVLSCKNAKIKIVRSCPYATLNPFGNVNVMFFILTSSVFFSHSISWLKCDEDLRHRKYHVARTAWVRGRMWLGRGCAWRGDEGGCVVTPPPDGWQAGGTHPAGMLTDTQPWPINRIYVLTDCTVKSAPFQVVRCTLNW